MDHYIKQIAENFSRHNFEITFPFLAEQIQWNIMGALSIKGKENVALKCLESSDYLKTVETNFTKFLILECGDSVVVDSFSEYIDQDQKVSKVASCDIYPIHLVTLQKIL
jgi:glutathione peroxidase-family protein